MQPSYRETARGCSGAQECELSSPQHAHGIREEAQPSIAVEEGELEEGDHA